MIRTPRLLDVVSGLLDVVSGAAGQCTVSLYLSGFQPCRFLAQVLGLQPHIENSGRNLTYLHMLLMLLFDVVSSFWGAFVRWAGSGCPTTMRLRTSESVHHVRNPLLVCRWRRKRCSILRVNLSESYLRVANLQVLTPERHRTIHLIV